MLDFGAHDDHREHFRAQCREDIGGMQSPSEEKPWSKTLPGQYDKLSCKDTNSKREGHVDMKDCCPKQDPGQGQSRSTSKRKLKPCGYCSEIHVWGKLNCSYFGKRCSFCGIFNHNAVSCWFKQVEDDEGLNNPIGNMPIRPHSATENYGNQSIESDVEQFKSSNEILVDEIKDSDPPTDSEPEKAAEAIQEYDPSDLEPNAIDSGKSIDDELINESERNLVKSDEFGQDYKCPLVKSEIAAAKCEENESAKSKRNKKKRSIYRNKQKNLSKKKATGL